MRASVWGTVDRYKSHRTNRSNPGRGIGDKRCGVLGTALGKVCRSGAHSYPKGPSEVNVSGLCWFGHPRGFTRCVLLLRRKTYYVGGAWGESIDGQDCPP